jgi:type II restriction enzyme
MRIYGPPFTPLRNPPRCAVSEFKLPKLYAHSEEPGKLHPENQHVDENIRQQLQELRDLGILKFVEPGFYRLL